MVDWRAYGLYHARWQLSAVVMVAPVWVFTMVVGLSPTLALLPAHVIGATVFWYVDKWIFTSAEE
jgi:hypothetical protein